MRPSFPFVSWNGRFQVIVSIPDHCLPFYFFMLESPRSVLNKILLTCSRWVDVPLTRPVYF